MHFGSPNDVFHITGPLGVGLNIEEGGNYIFFCSGTGVLPFIDLFAYMLRKAVALLSPGNTFFEDEEFEFNEIFVTVYCFFT